MRSAFCSAGGGPARKTAIGSRRRLPHQAPRYVQGSSHSTPEATLGSVPCACVLVSFLYINRLCLPCTPGLCRPPPPCVRVDFVRLFSGRWRRRSARDRQKFFSFCVYQPPTLMVQGSFSLRVLLWFSWGLCPCVSRSVIHSFILVL